MLNPHDMQQRPVLKSISSYELAKQRTGLPDFSWSKQTKTGIIYQMTTNYTNVHKIYLMADKIFQHFPHQGPPKYTRI
jgi:hypothetical protein